jgi:hypothetical protein
LGKGTFLIVLGSVRNVGVLWIGNLRFYVNPGKPKIFSGRIKKTSGNPDRVSGIFINPKREGKINVISL